MPESLGESKKTMATRAAGLTLSTRSKAIKKTTATAKKVSRTEVRAHNGTEAASESLPREKYNKQFQFFYSRTCFRNMIEYYKKLYQDMKDEQKHPKQVLQDVKWPDMEKVIKQLLVQELGLADVVEGKVGSELECTILVVTMMMILFTHRHKKGDRFIVQAEELIRGIEKADQPAHGLMPFLNGTDDEDDHINNDVNNGSVLQMKWEVIRDCLYKYSKRAQDRFFKYFIEAYLFARFGLSDSGNDFILSKDDMCAEKRPKIEAEMSVLTKEAVDAVERLASSESNPLSAELTARLLRDIRQKQ